jgi:integrase
VSKRANGEGSVRQRCNGRWEARLTLGYGPDGRIIRRSIYADTRAEAQQLMNKAMREAQLGIPPVDER